MKTLPLDSGSPEWFRARGGLPSASQFDRILTPKTRKPAAGRSTYRAELLAEYLLGQPLDSGSSGWMERGVEMEEEARRWYAMERDVDVTRAGLVLRDDGLVVGSPDGLVGEDGVVEIKCPSAAQHMRYRLGEEPDYLGQVQGYLYLTGRQWCDFLSYHPELKPFLRRYPRDEEYLAALVPVLDEFAEQCARDREDFAVERVLRPWDMEMRAEMNEANREEV